MSRRQLVVAFVACCLAPATAHATDVVELIPGDTLGYVVINDIADTDEKIEAMGQRMKLPIPSLLSLVKTRCGIAEGIDESGSITVAFLPASQGPAAVLYVPVDDYGALIEQLEPEDTEDNITSGRLMGRPVIVGKKNSHAVLAWPNNRALLTRVLADEANGRDRSDTVESLEGDHNVAAFISSGGVKMLTALGQQGLEEVKEVVRQQFAEDNPAVAGVEVYSQLLNAISSEAAAVAVGVKLEEGGSVCVDKWVWVQPTGRLAPILRDAKPYHGELLKGLPNMPYVVAIGGVLPSDALKPMMDFSGNMMKAMPQLYGLTPEQVDKMMDLAVKYFPDMRGMSFVVGVGQGDAPIHSNMLAAMHVRDANAFMASYRAYWEKLEDVIAEAEGSFLKDAKLEDVKVDGRSVLKIKMPIPGIQGFDLPHQGEIDALMKRLYGSGDMTLYFAAADDETVLVAYNEMANLRKALQATEDEMTQIARNRDIASTSKHLPSGGQMVGYWSPSGTVGFANRIMRLVSGPETSIQLPAFPDTPPVGWAMTAAPSIVKFKMFLPAETLEALGSFIEELRQIDGAPPQSK